MKERRQGPLQAACAVMLMMLAATAVAQTAPAEGAAPAAEGISYDKARRTAEASLRLHPATDSTYDYRPLWAGNADLDGDGRREIVYVYTAAQTGAAQQLNELVVMTALADNDPRAQAPAPGKSVYDDETYALIRASGYADDASVHVPGEVESVTFDAGRIVVAFSSARPTRLCGAGKGRTACPSDGRHTWTYAWTAGKLARAD